MDYPPLIIKRVRLAIIVGNMRIQVKAKPSAKIDQVEQLPDGSYVVSVKEPPIQGRANHAIIRLLAEHFAVPASSVRISQGWTSRQKVIEVTQG